ncbi:DEAD/DEAH box helicase family protein [Paenibacillus sp. DMB20]|uniref:DEAD/DEAH box helicase family protein n=1 Tax=Paenibacillus sp. DMB20 TaxID=1642570 RepID=UPI000627E225|nr:DEAD/DEAH box helicase family protein [Paenibacillus sp. DMB20]KKO53251.1 restriction endonuclease subunit R [Paenibacillus sp. DMB20]
MKQFPSNISFRYPWRSYQKRILDELDHHLKNRHLHLVAPPGSGKTVLGLEVMLRVNGPTFIVAPTLTIKNQWADRFRDLFLQTGELPEWVSTNLKKPAFVTITTYQALHSLYKADDGTGADDGTEEGVAEGLHSRESGEGQVSGSGTEREESPEAEEIRDTGEAGSIMEALNRLSFTTLILDEAHHLRSSWWKSTLHFRSGLRQPTVIALTATPPYDVQQTEWQRYIELCGPIDAEISVPELVRESELCPHQDYVYLSVPEKEEYEPLHKFRTSVRELRQELLQHAVLRESVESHPWIAETEKHMEEILSTPSCYSSMVIYLKAIGHPEWERSASVLGVEGETVPALSDEWLEELLTWLLYKEERMDTGREEFAELRRRLKGMGAVEKRKVYLRSTPEFDKMFVQSVSKLRSIQNIVSFEQSVLKENLRMVILTDYIRKEAFPKKNGDGKLPSRLGVVPIFEILRLRSDGDLALGILTGSLVVLPVSAMPLVRVEAEKAGVPLDCKPLPHDDRYVTAELKDSDRSALVAVITKVFSQGGIKVLVGTAALLGEGWDAPCINSLIMASYVGSFMLSNQMRGRAIRTEKGNADKTAAIWHLACLDTAQEEGGRDLDSLGRRFRSLVGLAVHRETIETGIGRMDTLMDKYTAEAIEAKNQETFDRARNRHLLHERWKKAVVLHDHMTEELVADGRQVPRPYYFAHTIKGLLIWGGIVFSTLLLDTLLTPEVLFGDCPFWMKLLLAMLVGIIPAGRPVFKGISMYVKHQSLESSIREVGQVVYETLYHMKLLEPEPNKHRIQAEDNGGTVVCWMEGGTTQEKTLFLNSLQQVLEPVKNPRYLLYRESRSGLLTRKDFHALPEPIDRKKEDAERFAALWRKKIGPAELVYTRTTEGRKILLTARLKAMSARFSDKSERISAWR